jgi:hypothetical protein
MNMYMNIYVSVNIYNSYRCMSMCKCYVPINTDIYVYPYTCTYSYCTRGECLLSTGDVPVASCAFGYIYINMYIDVYTYIFVICID